jgi:hypothetical protein
MLDMKRKQVNEFYKEKVNNYILVKIEFIVISSSIDLND